MRMTGYVSIHFVISTNVFYRSFLHNIAFLREHLDPAHLPRMINSTMLWPLLVFVMGVSPWDTCCHAPAYAWSRTAKGLELARADESRTSAVMG
jgi:hypothetical protein